MTRRDFGTIFRRKGSRKWYVRFYAGRGRAQRRYERPAGPTREIAKDKLRHVQNMLAERKPVELVLQTVFGDPAPNARTLEEAVAPYLDHVLRHRKPSTYTGYRYLLDVVRKAPWARKDLGAILHAEITRWLDEKQRSGLADQTLNNYLSVISGLFRWAMERGLAEDNPARRVRWRTQGAGRETYVSGPEARALVRAASPAFRPLLACALSTGMRRGELLTLCWRGVDLERQTISIAAEDAKNHRTRTIPMTSDLYAELAKLAISKAARLRHRDSLVFAHDDGRPLSPSAVTYRLRAAVEACAEIRASKKPKVTMHTLRHTAASLMVQGGRPIFDVAKILGHQDVKTTMRYAHFAPEAGRDTIDMLGKMLDLHGDQRDDDSVHDSEEEYGIG